jgi:hypothetical protein
MSNEINDFLFGGGGRAAQFVNVGDMVIGKITDVKLSQQTAMETNEPLTWPDGKPRMQLVVSLKTEEKVDDDDDGMRTVFAKGGKYQAQEGTGTSLKDAIAEAMKKAKANSIEVGGTLKVAYTGTGVKTNRGFTAPKLYRASYTAPVQAVSADEIFGDDSEF